MSHQDQDRSTPQPPSGLQFFIGLPGSRLRRTKYFLTGVLMPLTCVIAGIWGVDIVRSAWQSGSREDYIAMLLRGPALFVMLPLLAYSMICLSLWVFVPKTAALVAVRMGIYGGAILSGQYLILLLYITGPVSPLSTTIGGPVFAAIMFAIAGLARRLHRFTILNLMGLTTIFAVALVTLRFFFQGFEFLGIPILYTFVCGPTLNFVTYVWATVELVKQKPTSRNRPASWFVGWIAWIAAWFGSWKIALDRMFEEYAKLPTTNPSCYVSSAAAFGHQRFVGSQPSRDGAALVNLQMCRLKFLEFSLAAAAPSVHARIRRSYNRWGPGFAQYCRANVWFSDATYLMLKPIEIFALVIAYFSSVRKSKIRQIYF